jgi:nickel transport system permease protein
MLAIIIMGVFAPFFAPHDPAEMDVSARFLAPSFKYPLGTDHLGRCVLSRIIFGIRTSVLMVMACVFITVGIGCLLGFLAAVFEGFIDETIMRFCDIFLSFPNEVMTFAIIGIFGTGMMNILLASVLTSWAWYARIIRTVIKKYTKMNYIYFARVIGSGGFDIFIKHIMPVTFGEIMVVSSSKLCSMILTVTGFSFLGLGIQPPAAEWGMMLNEAKDVMLTHPSLMLPPGIAVMTVSLTSGFFSDSVRNILDAKHNHAKNSMKQKPRRP